MSPDPLSLHYARDTSTQIRERPIHTEWNPDEGYQTKTDSDHVTSFVDVSAEPCTRGRHADTSTNGPGFLPSNLHDLSSPSTAPSPHVEAPENDRQLSSPLSSPTGSPGAQSTGSLLRPLSANKPTSAQKATRETATNEPQRPDDKGGAPVRQLRQRKAVQLAPYSTEFSKFASLANKNSWEGIISAGLKEAFLEKERAKAESQKRQRDLSDEWLVHGNEDEEEQEADFSEPSSGPSSPRRQRRSTPAVNAELITHPSASSEKYSRSRREREWDPIANRLKAARKPSDVYRRVVRSSHPSSSRITIEDLERSAIRRASRRSEKRASNNETVKAVKHADTAARAAQVSKARKAGLLPSDVESSSSERENRSSRKRQATSQARPSADGSAAAVTTVIESSETDESVSDRPLGSDSPDRPIATRKDRFTLKGKRKRAAMFMMPAVALKKAEADLRLMEREMAEGKQIRLEELDDDEATNDAVPKSAKAKKRWRPQNTNRPFRYVTELSTDESDSGASRDGSPADDDDETQAAMHVWANMAAGKTQAAQDTSNQYWDKVIGRILLRRDRKARTAATRRRRKPGKKSDRSGKEHQQPADDGRRSFKPPSRSKQSTIAQHFVAPVYLDTADRLFEHCRSQSAVNRVAPRSKDQSKAFWRVLAGPTSTLSHVSEAVSTKATAEVVDTPTAASVHTPIGCLSENTDATSKFARFSFDYNIERLPAGLKFASSSYLAAGCLHEHLCHLKGEPTFSVPDPVAPFGIRLDNAMSSEVLLQILPRLMDCMYEYTIGEIASVNLHGSVNQALRFLGYYGLVWHFQDSAYATVRSAIFEQLSSLETRLDTYLAEVDDVDSILSSSMIAIKWAMFEITTLAYAVIYRHADAASKEAARHHILETMTYLVQSLLQSSPAKLASKLREITSLDQSDDVQILVEDIYCETWVCLINVCTVTQNIAGYEFLSLGSFWHTVEHCLNEAAIEQSLHPIVRGEASSFVAMLLCAISQFNASGESIATPQMSAHWPIISQALDNIKSQDFAHAYSAMSSPNRARISRYIWTVFARILHMSTRWEWPILDQGKLVGKMFDILDSRQLQDFTIEGEADFPAFLSNFSGKISTEIDHDDTVFHLFLRILSQAAFECNRQNDRKSTMTLARIAMRIMPMREYLQYGRHNITGKNLDRSVLVNHCALLIVLAIVDPSTAERRFAKLKTVLDFAGSDARARQDYLKAIMFIGIVYKVRGIDLSPVLSWLSHTADYLCSSYSQCAKRRAALLAVKRKAGSNLKNGQHHSSTTVLKHASAPLPDVTVDMEIQLVNRDMAEMAVMEGLLLGAVQQIMLVKPADDATITVTYPCLDYLNTGMVTACYEGAAVVLTYNFIGSLDYAGLVFTYGTRSCCRLAGFTVYPTISPAAQRMRRTHSSMAAG